MFLEHDAFVWRYVCMACGGSVLFLHPYIGFMIKVRVICASNGLWTAEEEQKIRAKMRTEAEGFSSYIHNNLQVIILLNLSLASYK